MLYTSLCGVAAAAGQHLRRQIERRSGDVRLRRAVQLTAGAEIHQHQPAVVGDHHVLRLDIAMQQARRVDRRHRATHLDADSCDFLLRKCRPVAKRLFERAALDELHPQPDAAVDPFSAVDRDDVRMADAGEQPAFFDDAR